MSDIIVLLLLLICLTYVFSFIPRANRMVSSKSSENLVSSSSSSSSRSSKTIVSMSDRNVFNSKFLSGIGEDELADLFKEFNITNYDINSDPEMMKWNPSKEFFEKFGFQNNTEKYAKKTMDAKIDFYKAYTKPILPQYKTFIADLITVYFIQRSDSRYKYDALQAFGMCTQYYTIMKGYALADEIDVIFNELLKCVGFDPALIREDAKKILSSIKDSNLTEDEVLNGKEGVLTKIFDDVRTNRFFKYTDAWGVGLGRIIELLGVEPNETSFERWCKSLKWVFAQRVMQTWNEFTADQVRLQGVEAMQKQLLIREKKRAAARLEKKALDFDDKKKALMELNVAIEERRRQLIEEQKGFKKKYEPDAYEKIILEEKSVV